MEFESRLKDKYGLGCASTSHSSVTSSPREAIVIRDADIFGRPIYDIIIYKIIVTSYCASEFTYARLRSVL